LRVQDVRFRVECEAMSVRYSGLRVHIPRFRVECEARSHQCKVFRVEGSGILGSGFTWCSHWSPRCGSSHELIFATWRRGQHYNGVGVSIIIMV
jgi:hypothetical protein